jgi:hypothetical protein
MNRASEDYADGKQGRVLQRSKRRIKFNYELVDTKRALRARQIPQPQDERKAAGVNFPGGVPAGSFAFQQRSK